MKFSSRIISCLCALVVVSGCASTPEMSIFLGL